MPAKKVPETHRNHSAVRYLVDTDWTIDYLNGIERIVRNLNNFLTEGVGISIISLAEIYDGVLGTVSPEENEEQLNAFLASVEVLSLDDGVCRTFAAERRRLRAAGNIISDFDLLIGSTALRHDLTLLTNNRRHFERVQDLSIISV